MESRNSKKSSADLAPGPKQLKMVELGASLDLQIGITEETESQQCPAETPAQKVLRLPELLSMIFGHLAADSDLTSLKIARVVCSLWKHEVFITLRNNLSLMPCIVADDDDLQSAMESLMPGCGFPLKLTVDEWSPELETFIRDFSREIVHFEIFGLNWFEGFPVKLATIELPALRYASFSALGIHSCNDYLVEFAKVVKVWNEVVRASKNLKKSDFCLEMSGSARDLSFDNAAFDQLDWSRVNTLNCTNEFFVEVNAAHELSALDTLDLYAPSVEDRGDDDDLVRQISLKKIPNLKRVTFSNQVEWILDHQMKKLEVVCLKGTTISGTPPPSKLLPNLKFIELFEGSMTGRSLDCLTRGGGVFEKAIDLTWFAPWTDLNERIDDVAVQLCVSFPNLTNLKLHSKNGAEILDGNNNHALLAAPIIFSRLEFLTTSELCAILPTEREVVELVTGISLENIPEEEESWPTALVGNIRSVANLKHLNLFHLEVTAEFVRIVPRHTRFLFAAAFRTMDTLEKLIFWNINFDDTSCATQWQELGRQITLEQSDLD